VWLGFTLLGRVSIQEEMTVLCSALLGLVFADLQGRLRRRWVGGAPDDEGPVKRGLRCYRQQYESEGDGCLTREGKRK
jgi:hypothetical protein